MASVSAAPAFGGYCPEAKMPEAAAPAFFCAACNEGFLEAAEFRAHSKSERHVYNTKRKLNNLRPISLEAWTRKLKEARDAAGAAANKGTAHLKAGKEKRSPKQGPSAAPSPVLAPTEAAELPPSGELGEDATPAVSEPFSPRRCLFDRRHFGSVEACLSYMEKKYSFFIPDVEYCTDVNGLLHHLWSKLHEPPFQCIACNRPFPDAQSVRRHMFDKCHTHIGSEVHSRRGLADHRATEQLKGELEEFFDFRASLREVTVNFRPAQKIAALVRYFDADADGRLNFEELAALWAAASGGGELSEGQYQGACGMAEADPDEGLDADELAALYAGGLADLDEHFAMLQAKLEAKPSRSQSTPNSAEVGQALAEVPEGQEEEGSEEPAAADEEGEEDDEDASDDDDEASDVEVVECEDEDEFEEVMRILGLVRVELTEEGNLRMPGGGTAAHRSVAHIFRQRGIRPDAQQLAAGRAGHGAQKALGGPRVQLMLANSAAGTKVAMTQRQSKREGKRVIAMLKRKNEYDMHMGIKSNLIQTNRIMKTRSVRGDASGAGGGGR